MSMSVGMWVRVCVSEFVGEYVNEWCEWVSVRVSMLVSMWVNMCVWVWIFNCLLYLGMRMETDHEGGVMEHVVA